ncbi:MAG: hypothetical protein IJQ68_07520 [Methanobrevibacter sp.]|uniref:hypothetical protein n=1 Tax=Methanobrevibacter sp. TaxID=66852 RepID=UPI0025E1CAE5|nr:hypothetical protein [Methanobrevibacter sp.]MBR0271819.1 hypothetical protein [Methanobrevibacter sp.]
MIPIRCLSCGKPVSAYFDQYQIRKIGGKQLFEELEDRDLTHKFIDQVTINHEDANKVLSDLGLRGNYSKEDSKDILDDLGLTRYCCRRMLISHVETWE